MNPRQEVIATLSYYDFLDIPLTVDEVFRFLIRASESEHRERGGFQSLDIVSPNIWSRHDVVTELERLQSAGTVQERNSYFHLHGREYLIPLRLRHEEFFKKKWRRAMRIARALQTIPFIRAIFASGSLALGSTDEMSDLDVLVVARHGRIWLTRLFVLGLLEIFGIRRTHRDSIAPDKVCPNHFITDQSLAIPFHSLYTAQMYANLRPLFAVSSELLERFRIENEWLFHHLYHWQMTEPAVRKHILHIAIRKAGETILFGPIGDVAEWLARRFQTWLINRHRKPTLERTGHLVYDDSMLAFHEGSSEQDILERYTGFLKRFVVG
ncbi:MAG: hypothetical protein A3A33_03470 [Candidatus Yanofskybacteria bacterium RIFCSPLOWO2_01_FULL_49_25]|uniref:Polymerase nucleotidyl transferase domain-containing protein n=1 Tax=Candidatus Yanofskybacteria bacterium RIFCSPLOWO2_01_FULL_49_25 TaxID=1802701 RepID=A0A1F8GTQ3_9BACT|nr:MAG: hypothetical protein A3A33_03470 [Candidatus Yanofskybacteria bacterium RIFCSPLOWO2_01_FULL_49_25]